MKIVITCNREIPVKTFAKCNILVSPCYVHDLFILYHIIGAYKLQRCTLHSHRKKICKHCRTEKVESRVRSTNEEDEDMYPSDEARLINLLMPRLIPHNKLARPVRNSTTTVTVYFGLDLKQILDFDEKDQVLQTRIWKEYVSTMNCF